MKTYDGALEKIDEAKADKTMVESIQESVKKESAMQVFNDMKLLFDTTVKQFDEKVTYERNLAQKQCESVIKD